MGSITDGLQAKIIAAMKAKSPELGTLRMLSSALKNAVIEKRRPIGQRRNCDDPKARQTTSR